MSTEATSRLSGLRFVNPQHAADDALAQSFRTVLAGGSTPLPGESHALEVAIAGAGQMFDLAGWNEFTHGTSLVVLRHGQVVHEWYAEGARPRRLLPRRLDDQVRARAPGRRRRAGARAAASTTASSTTCPSWPAAATTRAPCATC